MHVPPPETVSDQGQHLVSNPKWPFDKKCAILPLIEPSEDTAWGPGLKYTPVF